jgi:hypothetical protein
MLRAPFRPAVAGRIAFWFSPIAGALVSVISLRRMNWPAKANRVFLFTVIAAIGLSILLLLIPHGPGRLVGLLSELAFWLVFPRIQHQEFEDWQKAHPDVPPSTGWRAIGWGLVGLLLFLLIFLLIAVTVSFLVKP